LFIEEKTRPKTPKRPKEEGPLLRVRESERLEEKRGGVSWAVGDVVYE